MRLNIYILFIYTSLSFSTLASGAHSDNSQFDESHLLDTYITRNTVRKNPADWLARSILQLKTKNGRLRSSAFFVENKLNRIYVATARHCVQYNMTDSCHAQNFDLVTVFQERVGSCKRVVAGSTSDDLIIIEVEFSNDHEVKEFSVPLKIASYFPKGYRRFEMVGFPHDYYRKGQFTSATNCWADPGGNYHANQNRSRREIEYARRQYSKRTAKYKEAARWLSPVIGYYNCSVWGGNSGGPILIENTRDVIGLPYKYSGVPKGERPPIYEHNMVFEYESTYGFVERHRRVLANEGVVISDTCPVPLEQHRKETRRRLGI